MSDSHLRYQGLMLPITVQQFTLCGRAHERLEFVLPVNVDEDVARLA